MLFALQLEKLDIERSVGLNILLMSFDCSYGGALLLKCCFFPTHFVFCFLDILRVFLEQGMLFLMMLPSLLYLIL